MGHTRATGSVAPRKLQRLLLLAVVAFVAPLATAAPPSLRSITYTEPYQAPRDFASIFIDTFYTWEFDQEISMRLQECSIAPPDLGRPECGLPTIVPCCDPSTCSLFTPLPNASLPCFCSSPGLTCMDAYANSHFERIQQPVELLTGPPPVFELAVWTDCFSWRLDLLSDWGDADMTIVWPTGGSVQDRDVNDHFLVCAEAGPVSSPSSVLGADIRKGAPSPLAPPPGQEPWVRVQVIILPKYSSNWTLDLKLSDGNPSWAMVSPTTHYNLIPFNFACPGQTCVDPFPDEVPERYLEDCWYDPMAAATELGSEWSILAHNNLSLGTVIPNAIRLRVHVQIGLTTGLITFMRNTSDYGNCSASFVPDLFFSLDGEPFVMSPVDLAQFRPTLARDPPCEASTELRLSEAYLATQSQANLVRQHIENFGTQSLPWIILGSRILANAARPCVENNRAAAIAVKRDQGVVSLTQQCTIPEQDSPAWLADPCCNTVLQATQCCAARDIENDAYDFVPNEEFIATCSDQACATEAIQVVSETRASKGLALDNKDIAGTLTRPCIITFVQTLGLLSALVEPYDACTDAMRVVDSGQFPCTVDADCPWTSCNVASNVCNPSTSVLSFARCMWESLTPTYMRSLITGSSTFEQFVARYIVCPQTQQSEICTWDPSVRSAQACLSGLSQISPNFCARISSTGIEEMSVFGGCRAWHADGRSVNQLECLFAPDPFLNQPRVYAQSECWLPSSVTRDECLPPGLCAFPGGSSCPAFCYLSPLDSATCAGLQSFPGLENLLWNPQLVDPATNQPGLCVFVGSDQWSQGICETLPLGPITPNWFPGHVWETSKWTSEAACLAGGCAHDSCFDQAGANTCSDTECRMVGDCLPTSFPAVDACVAPAALTFDGSMYLEVYVCPPNSYLREDALCVYPQYATEAECLASSVNFVRWLQAGVNQSTCSTATVCVDFQGSQTQLPGAECTLCQGQLRSSRTFVAPNYYEPGLLQWLPRAWTLPPPPSNSSCYFDAGSYFNDVYIAQMTLLGQGNAAMWLCINSQSLFKFARTVLCSCADRSLPEFGASLLTCTQIQSSTPSIGSPLLCSFVPFDWNVEGQARIIGTDTTVFTSSCAQMQVLSVSGLPFTRKQPRALTSAFVESLKPSKYDVVRNSAGIRVGRVIGDGLIVTYVTDGSANSTTTTTDDASLPNLLVSGNLTLCIPLGDAQRYSKRRSTVYDRYDFAWTDRIGDPTKLFQASNLRVQRLDITVVPFGDGGQYLCAAITKPGMYLPVARSSPDASFFDTLSAEQQACLIILVLAFALAWLVTVAALIEIFVLTTKYLVSRLRHDLESKVRSPFLRLGVFGTLSLVFLIRFLYFILVLAGVMEDAPLVINAILVELPTYLYLTVLTLLVLVWTNLAVSFLTRGSTKRGTRIRMVLTSLMVVTNIVLYTLFIVFVILLGVYGDASNSNSEPDIVCATNVNSDSNSDPLRGYTIFYHIVVALLIFCVAGAFVVVLIVVLTGIHAYSMIKNGGWRVLLQQIFLFSFIVLLCSVALVAQAIILLVGTWVSIPTVAAMFLLLTFEWLPAFVLVASMMDVIKKPIVKAAERTIGVISSGSASTGTDDHFTTDRDF